MLTKEQAHEFAEHWVQSWNSHDLDEIMSHYEEDVVLVSPVAAQLKAKRHYGITSKRGLKFILTSSLSLSM
jgi:ketosteroid isomerase-like protein